MPPRTSASISETEAIARETHLFADPALCGAAAVLRRSVRTADGSGGNACADRNADRRADCDADRRADCDADREADRNADRDADRRADCDAGPDNRTENKAACVVPAVNVSFDSVRC